MGAGRRASEIDDELATSRGRARSLSVYAAQSQIQLNPKENVHQEERLSIRSRRKEGNKLHCGG